MKIPALFRTLLLASALLMGLLPLRASAQEAASKPDTSEVTMDLFRVYEAIKQTPWYLESMAVVQEAAIMQDAAMTNWWLPEVNVGTSMGALDGVNRNAEGTFLQNVEYGESIWGVELDWEKDLATSIAGKKASLSRLMSAFAKTEHGLMEFTKTCMALGIDSRVAWSRKEAISQSRHRVGEWSKDAMVALNNGVMTETELKQIEVLAYTLMAQEVSNAKGLVGAETALSVMMRTGGSWMWVGEWFSQVPELNLASMEGSWTNHPMGEHLNFELEAREREEKGAAWSRWMPSLKASPTMGGWGSDWARMNATSNWVAALTWRLPIQDLFQVGDYSRKTTNRKVAEQQLKTWYVERTAKIERVLAELMLAEALLSSQQSVVEAANIVRGDMEHLVTLGLASTRDRIEAEKDWLDARLMQITYEAELVMQIWMLYIETSGDFSVTSGR